MAAPPATGSPSAGVASTSGAPLTSPGGDLPPSPVPPPPTVPPSTLGTSAARMDYSKLPRMLKATYLTPGEKLLWETRPTRWFYFPGPVLYLILVGFLGLYLYEGHMGKSLFGLPYPSSLQSANGSLLEIMIVILLLVGVLYFAVKWYEWARVVYVVTSTRVIRQKGILAADFDEVQLQQVRGVDVKQHILQRILHYGTVRVSAEFGGTAQAMGNEDWPGVPRCIEFERTIEEAQQRVRGLLGPQAMGSGATAGGPTAPRHL